MAEALRVSEVSFAAAKLVEQEGGLLGYFAVTLNDSLRLDGLTLRRSLDGRLVISYPSRRGRSGHQHFYVRPLNDEVRREIEFQVFAALGFRETAAR